MGAIFSRKDRQASTIPYQNMGVLEHKAPRLRGFFIFELSSPEQAPGNALTPEFNTTALLPFFFLLATRTSETLLKAELPSLLLLFFMYLNLMPIPRKYPEKGIVQTDKPA
jgi:hypothetical protein